MPRSREFSGALKQSIKRLHKAKAMDKENAWGAGRLMGAGVQLTSLPCTQQHRQWMVGTSTFFRMPAFSPCPRPTYRHWTAWLKLFRLC